MAYSYTQLQEIKTRIIQQLAQQQNAVDAAKAQFTVIKTTLTDMQSTYGGWATEVNTLATANPNDDAIKALKAERDLLVNEFATTKTRATAIETAVTGL